VRCETAVDEALPVGGLFRIAAQQKDVLAAPTEAGGAEGQGGGLVGAEGVEKFVDAGFGDGGTGVVKEGDEARYHVQQWQAALDLSAWDIPVKNGVRLTFSQPSIRCPKARPCR